MGTIKAGVPGTITPIGGQDYGTHDSRLGIGGYVEVDDIAMRDAIIADRLRVGMLVYCVAENKTFRLTSLSPKTWTEASGGGGGPQLVFANPDPSVTLDALTWQVMFNERNGSVAVALPAPTLGRRIEIIDDIGKAGSTAPITLDPGAGVDVDGDAELTIDLDWAWLTLIGDGTNWRTGT